MALSAPYAVPYGGYWCTPFARWQGSLAHVHSLELAAHGARLALTARGLEASAFDGGVLGLTVPQRHSFYGLPWLAAMLGAPGLAGPTIMQACATGARVLATACGEIASGVAQCVLAITADRVSNGPHLYYPDPGAAGGTGMSEDWVIGNFERDPHAACAMVETAENCARHWSVDTAEQHALVVRRYEQYQAACAPDAHGRCFHDRYMLRPFPVPGRRPGGVQAVLDGDEGVHPTSAEGLARLRPLRPDGTVTYGGQTHPADGNAGMIVTTPERARELSRAPHIEVRIVAWGQARAAAAWMPAAPIAAARAALAQAGLGFSDLAAIKSHNPFAVNDAVFARETGVDVMHMNNYGSSLIWGHPQAPTGMRAIIELIEELAERGGGYGLYHGCAAGDSAMAVVVAVDG